MEMDLEKKKFNCVENHCSYSTNDKSNLNKHLWQVHDLGKGQIFLCTEEFCNFKAKIKNDVKIHLWTVHNIGSGDIFYCEESDSIFVSTETIGSAKRSSWQERFADRLVECFVPTGNTG